MPIDKAMATMSERLEGRTGTVISTSGLSEAAPGPDATVRSWSRVALVERAQTGDRAAFDRLLEQSFEPSFRLALAILGNEEDACDATQDALLGAWRDLRRLRDPGRFDAWLTRILVNSCRGLRRRRRRVAIREIDLGAVAAAAEPAVEFEAAWGERPASLDALEHAFERLSLQERSILALHHLQHRPVDEIAEALRIPVGTAKSRLFTARRALERALEDELR